MGPFEARRESVALMEKQLFEWDGFDLVDTAIMQFYNCTLKRDIGTCKEGETVDSVVLDYSNGKWEIQHNGVILAKGEMELVLK